MATDGDHTAGPQTLRDVLFPEAPITLVATTKLVGKRLRRHIGESVTPGGSTFEVASQPAILGPKGALLFVQVTAHTSDGKARQGRRP